MNSSEDIRNVPTEVVDDFLVVPQNDPNRPATYVAGDLYTTLATTRETDFDFNVIDFFAPVGGGPPQHYHAFEDELWYVTGGELNFSAGNQEANNFSLSEGGLFFSPREKVHSWGNADSEAEIVGNTPGARALGFVNPGALELLFEAAGILVTDRNAPIPPNGDIPFDLEIQSKFGARLGSPVVFTGLGAQ
ncbi:MAG: cupin domain-containing protein, partial [Cyanobacteria bacterium P01_A01_bin.40]